MSFFARIFHLIYSFFRFVFWVLISPFVEPKDIDLEPDLTKKIQRRQQDFKDSYEKGISDRSVFFTENEPKSGAEILDINTSLTELRSNFKNPEEPKQSTVVAIEEFSSVQLSEHTQRAYKLDLKSFIEFLRNKGLYMTWLHLSPVHIAEYREYLTKEKGLAKSTVTRKLAVIKSFYKWSKARGWTQNNPAELIKGYPQTQDSKTGFLSEREILQFLNFFPAIDGLPLSKALAKVVIESLLMLGVRRSEAAALTVGDLELLDGKWLITVRGKGDRDRKLPVPVRLIETWSDWFRRITDEAPYAEDLDESPEAWMDWIRRHPKQAILISTKAKHYNKRLSTAEIAYIVRRYAKKAGLIQRVSPHMLRASAITSALDYGASHRGVQQMAGWTSPLMITRYDKRRKDPKFSAVLKLKYANKLREDVEEPPSSND